jgi:ketosteroid isomerase-like protein
MTGMTGRRRGSAAEIVHVAVAAINRHDLAGFLACFDDQYRSEQPRHPERNFTGVERVAANWRSNLDAMADLEWEVLGMVEQGDRVAAEVRWEGTRSNGEHWREQGVILYTVRAGLIVAGRLYVEPVD